MRRVSDLPNRFQKYIEEQPNGCWIWTGVVTSSGYARVMVNRVSHPAHRYIWTLFNGPVPDGMVCDHLCMVRECVNPSHIEPVTHQENIRRAVSKEFCSRGHNSPRNADNSCIKCHRESMRKMSSKQLTCDFCGDSVKYYSMPSHKKRRHGISGIDFKARFMQKVVINENGCWVWQRYINPGGYGLTKVNRKTVIAHRAAYEMFVGPIGEGLTIDHTCRTRACVNPEHLEPVTIQENLRRMHSAKSV